MAQHAKPKELPFAFPKNLLPLVGMMAAMLVCIGGIQLANISALADESEVPAISPEQSVLESTADYRKNEVVYSMLSADGTQKSSYIINQFEVKQPGRVVDYGHYDSVQNLTTEDTLLHKNGATAFDMMEAGVFYYQGDCAKLALPWSVAIEYKLDGKTCTDPQELAGKSGELEIHLQTTTQKLDDSSFFDSFLQQITFTLPDDACSNIQAEGATIASAGSNRTVAFAVLPGREADCTLTATVENFHMDGVQIAALPYESPVEMPDTSELTDGMQQINDAAAQLSSGAQSLSFGASEYAQGISQLKSQLKSLDTSQIDEFGGVINSTLLLLSGAFSGMQLGENELQYAASTLYETAAFLEELKGLDPTVYDLPASFNTFNFDTYITQCRMLADFLSGHAPQLVQLMQLSSDPTQAAALSAQLTELSNSLTSLKDGVSQLDQGAQNLAAGTQQYAQGASAFSSDVADGTATMQQETEEMMEEYEFPTFEPHSFASKENPADRIASVQFVLQSDAIEQAAEQNAAPEETKLTFIDRLRVLFGL